MTDRERAERLAQITPALETGGGSYSLEDHIVIIMAEFAAIRKEAHIAGMAEADNLCDGLPDGIDCRNAIRARITELREEANK